MIPYSWIETAAQRIAAHIQITPLTYDAELDIYLKWENHQVTGSFKARGAFNKILSLEKWEQEAGLLAASAGNHGQGVALAGKLVGAPAKIFAAKNAPSVKINAMRALGAEVILVPGGYGDAEKAALKLAKNSAATWISPYNDGQIIAGQGTVGLEIIHQLAAIPNFQLSESTWVVPASGGGLLTGVGAALSNLSPRPTLIGVQTDTSAFLHSIFHTGTQDGVIERPTIADGLAGPVEDGSITIPLTYQYGDDFMLVNEEETATALAFAWKKYGEKIEGSAAVALAAVLSGKIHQKPAVLILSGGNIQEEVFQEIIHRDRE
jgi:threonine dehydratase